MAEASGFQLPPGHRDAYERMVATLRTQLDEPTLITIWAEGRAMTEAQAIEYALADSVPQSL